MCIIILKDDGMHVVHVTKLVYIFLLDFSQATGGSHSHS